MKKGLIFVGLLTCVFTQAQEVFKEKGKYGVRIEDSVAVEPRYDAVKIIDLETRDLIYAVQENEEWHLISSNKLLNQQRYTEFVEPDFAPGLIYGYRDGYLDLIDLQKEDFLLRAVKAEKLIDGSDYLGGESDFLMTQCEEGYGLIDQKAKKEIVKCEYPKLIINEAGEDGYYFIGSKDGKNFLFDRSGKITFTLSTEREVTAFYGVEGMENGYMVEAKDKKGTYYGFYNAADKSLIEPMFEKTEALNNTPEVVLVKDKKGWGLYFQGKEILEAKYEKPVKSDKEGYLVKVVEKGETFYLSPSGELVQL